MVLRKFKAEVTKLPNGDIIVKPQSLKKYVPKKSPIRSGVKVETTQDKKQTEDEVKKSVLAYLKKNEYIAKTVFLGGIPTPSGMLVPNPLKGFPDLIVMHPAKQLFFLIELKKSHGGVLSQEQILWHKMLKHCKIPVLVVNSLQSLKQQLKEQNL